MRVVFLIYLAGAVLFGTPQRADGQASKQQTLNPKSLPPPRGYSHIVIAPAGRRVLISGQVSVDSSGTVVGARDFRAQCIQVFENLARALRSTGASFDDVVATTTYVTRLDQLEVLREVRARYLPADAPPASTLVQVVSLYRRELMIEVAVEAVVPDSGAVKR
jgi:enamine deaminase RidA (YjgF/YER057c/UK114 family)